RMGKGVTREGDGEAEAPSTTTRDGKAPVRVAEDQVGLYPREVSATIYMDPVTEGDTPYLCNTEGTILYKAGTSIHNPKLTTHYAKRTHQLQSHTPPDGYVANIGVNYIPFPITYEGKTIPTKYIQIIYHPEPIVLGVIDESNYVYSKPLFATPQYSLSLRPKYPQEDLILFEAGYNERPKIDRVVKDTKDRSLEAEIHRYRVASMEEHRVTKRLEELEQTLGVIRSHKLGSIRRLEAAGALERIEEAQRQVAHAPSEGQPYGSHMEVAEVREYWRKVLTGGNTGDLSHTLRQGRKP